jgi:Na+/H+-dicarboxylate symporter/ABC-type amino acid transport substrate-binding protein
VTPKPGFNLSRRILAGVAAGVFIGLFFGERAAILQVVAEAYVRLLQMTVLPYVTISIISGLGSLDLSQARRLGTRVGLVLMLLWVVALTAAFLVAMMFPPHLSASFFSTALLESPEPFDFIGLYIPSNPFDSLARSIVPAVVLFSITVGLALMTVPHKERLIEILDLGSEAIAKVTRFVVTLTPYGVFAIAAVFAGTLEFDTLKRLQVYFVSYIAIASLLSLWVLPGLVAALTPIPFRAVMSRTRDALILAFMTTSLFAVLPLLTQEAKALLRDYAKSDRRDEAIPDVVVPASFNFPHSGKLMALSFVLFAGWFSDTNVPLTSYPQLAGAGLLALFGSVNAAIPFLLGLFRIPSDTFQLFLASGIVNARFGTLVSAMHTLAVALLGACAVSGALRIDGRKLVRFGVITAVMTLVLVGGLRAWLQTAQHTPYDKDQAIASMQMLRNRGPAVVFTAGAAVPALPPVTSSIVDRLRERRTLRVGYFDDSLPYAFINTSGELVGFDIEMAHQLARDLGVGLELVAVSRGVLETGLDPAVCDLVMSGVAVTADRSLRVQFSGSYLDETVAFIVPDHMAPKFAEWSSIQMMGRLRVGVPQAPYFVRKIRDELPDIDIVPVESIEEMFRPRTPPLDAFVATAERGSAYTLLHPEYSVVVPKPRLVKVPLSYIIAGRDQALREIVDSWIDLKRKDGTIDDLFAHWILGQNATPAAPRWSIARDVLHWMR